MRALSAVTGGLVVGPLMVVMSISAASLVYGGELQPFLANGIGITLMASAATGLAYTQNAPAAILGVLAVGALASLPPTVRFATTVALVACTTLGAGALFLAVGVFRLGRLVRYMPHFDALASSDPSLAAAIHRHVVRHLAERAAHLQRVAVALQR